MIFDNRLGCYWTCEAVKCRVYDLSPNWGSWGKNPKIKSEKWVYMWRKKATTKDSAVNKQDDYLRGKWIWYCFIMFMLYFLIFTFNLLGIQLQKIKKRNEEYNQFLASKAEKQGQRRAGEGGQVVILILCLFPSSRDIMCQPQEHLFYMWLS